LPHALADAQYRTPEEPDREDHERRADEQALAEAVVGGVRADRLRSKAGDLEAARS
jgi:hypothetical protein